ncbi:transmembrane protein 151B-like protein, partial [Leptotrombidium deliense]
QKPEKQTFCESLKRDSHIKCLVLTLLIFGCLSAITWCSVAEVTRLVVNFQSFPVTQRRKVSPCDDGYIYIPIVFVIMLYMVYLVECWHCSTRLELVHKMDSNAIYDHIQQMRESQPIIWWKAVCYHYVRRTRQITRYRNGDAYTTTQIYYERINTHVAGSCFAYGSCGVKDISKNLVDLEKHPTTKIRFSKGFAFANLEAANEFEEQRARFFQDNETSDDYLEMREGLDLVGCNFQEYIVSFANKKQLPWYARSNAVLVHLTLLLLVVFVPAFILASQSAHRIQNVIHSLSSNITKLFGSNYVTPTINRANTVDSIELINNCVIAPSYSEVVLASRRNQNNENSNEDSTSMSAVKLCNDSSDRRQSVLSSLYLSNSCSRSSLINGQTVYFVPPLQSSEEPVIARRPSIRHVDIDAVDNPPTYEDALRRCPPVSTVTVFSLSPLRRSITDRDFFKRLTAHFRRPWGSTVELRDESRGEGDETQL